MALVGGGGAGNTVNPSGTGKGLNYVGEFAYAYSGTISVDNNEAILLEFDTGPSVIQADARFAYGAASGDDYLYKVYMNDEVILADASGGTTQAHWFPQYKFIIPPYTKVKLTAANITDTTANDQGVVVSGRVYA